MATFVAQSTVPFDVLHVMVSTSADLLCMHVMSIDPDH